MSCTVSDLKGVTVGYVLLRIYHGEIYIGKNGKKGSRLKNGNGKKKLCMEMRTGLREKWYEEDEEEEEEGHLGRENYRVWRDDRALCWRDEEEEEWNRTVHLERKYRGVG